MENEFLYMLAVSLSAIAVTFLIRAVPFLLFSGRRLPPAVEKAGGFVSPAIVACLVVYSYSGLAWRTPWPYAAGAATLAVHLLSGNPLASIASGTALYMAMLALCGCVSAGAIEIGASNPSISVTSRGIDINGERTGISGVVSALDRAGIDRNLTIHIFLDPGVTDAREARLLVQALARSGRHRAVLVTRRHGESESRSANTFYWKEDASGVPRMRYRGE